MHDPMTVAFEFKWPWFWMKYRPTALIIWHVDPETDGTDNSCGWAFPKLTKQQGSIMGHLAFCESRTPWFQRDPVKRIYSPADAEALMRGSIQMVAFALKIKISWREVCRLACQLTHNSADNFQGSLCHLPGWHTNFEEDTEGGREQHAKSFFCSVARVLLARERPWYKHPRWHIHHWSIQIPIVLNLKRWLFSRCNRCGGRFRYGESPVSNNWNGTGPQWFKSERDVFHDRCEGRMEAR